MMFRRYHHGHSAALGFLLALAMQRHTITLVLVAVLLGVVLGRAWSFWSDTARAVKLRLLNGHAKREPVEAGVVPVYPTRARRRRSQSDEIPF